MPCAEFTSDGWCYCSIVRKSDKLIKKLERQDKRKGRGPDPDLEWLIANQADALQILAGKRHQLPKVWRCSTLG